MIQFIKTWFLKLFSEKKELNIFEVLNEYGHDLEFINTRVGLNSVDRKQFVFRCKNCKQMLLVNFHHLNDHFIRYPAKYINNIHWVDVIFKDLSFKWLKKKGTIRNQSILFTVYCKFLTYQNENLDESAVENLLNQ